MADGESTGDVFANAKRLSNEAYDAALHLHTLLAEFMKLDAPWAFPLEDMADRLRDLADRAHCEIVRVAEVRA